MATTEEIQNGLEEIIIEIAQVPVDEVTPEKSFVDDLKVDSLGMNEIIFAAEDKFGVTIPDEEAANLKTVGDAINFIEKNQS